MTQAVLARCPVRIDLAGGTTDIWPIPLVLPIPPCTLNVALDLPATARIERRTDRQIVLTSQDQDTRVAYDDRAQLDLALREGSCPLPLLGLAVHHVGDPAHGVSVTTWAQSPKGAGLGGSSALLVALVGGLDHAAGRTRDVEAHRALAQDVETAVVKTPTGFQDYYPPLLGGAVRIERRVGAHTAERMQGVPLDALARRLRIVYTGVPHHSGLTNWGVVRDLFDDVAGTARVLEEIGANAHNAAAALARGDLDATLTAVLRDGDLRCQLAEGVVTPAIQALDAAAREAGALGSKVLGAGGGGCVLLVLPEGDDGAAVDAAVAASPGTSLPVALTSTGLTVETLE